MSSWSASAAWRMSSSVVMSESEIRIVDLKGRGAQYTYLAKAAESCRDAEAGASGRALPGQSLPVTAGLSVRSL